VGGKKHKGTHRKGRELKRARGGLIRNGEKIAYVKGLRKPIKGEIRKILDGVLEKKADFLGERGKRTTSLTEKGGKPSTPPVRPT